MTVLLALWLAAAPGPQDLLATAKQQLAQHHEIDARKTLERAKVLAAEQPALLAQIHLYLGLAFAESAEEKKATDSFQAALKLDRSLELPPDSSPKVVEWWTKAGGTVKAAVVAPPPTPPPAPAPASAPAPAPAASPPPAVEPAAPPAPAATVVESPSARSSSKLWLVGAGIAVAAGIAGGVLLAQAENRSQQLTMSPHLGIATSMNLASEGTTLQTAGWSLVATAAAAAVIAVVLAVVLQ